MKTPLPNLGRGEGRRVTRRTRTFRPNYLSFAGTYQCNLNCPHCCVPIEWADRLDVNVALRFLADARAHGIEILGFTGGEPFLYPDFLYAVCERAAELGFRFDKIMTNGVWHRNAAHLADVLERLRDAGFTGKLGLSVDKFHHAGAPPDQTSVLAEFCRTARRVFDRDNVVSLSYASRAPDQGLEPVRKLASTLDGVLEWSDVLRRMLLVTPELTLTVNWNHLAPVERAEQFAGGWDGTWFEEDYCEGPGQALIVNPKGEVKPCCGFASDLDQLTIGNIHEDTVADVIRKARDHPYVGKVFREGLTAIRDAILADDPDALPGATSNHCFFCWYVLTKNRVTLPAGLPGTSHHGRVSLTMAGDPLVPPALTTNDGTTTLLMVFDGKTVFLGRELPSKVSLGKGRVYLVRINGPAPVEPPPHQLTWTDYQTWIDRLRGDGFRLTTHNFAPCQK